MLPSGGAIPFRDPPLQDVGGGGLLQPDRRESTSVALPQLGPYVEYKDRQREGNPPRGDVGRGERLDREAKNPWDVR